MFSRGLTLWVLVYADLLQFTLFENESSIDSELVSVQTCLKVTVMFPMPCIFLTNFSTYAHMAHIPINTCLFFNPHCLSVEEHSTKQ